MTRAATEPTAILLGVVCLAWVALGPSGCSRPVPSEGAAPPAWEAGPPSRDGAAQGESADELAAVPPLPESHFPRCELVGSPVVWRYSPTLSVLPDGRVLVAGGRHHDAYDYLRSVELFDPRVRVFTPGPDLLEERAMHTAVTLEDGRVLVVGGLAKGLEVFDPSASTWSRAGSLRQELVGVGAALAEGGQVAIVGGDVMVRAGLSTARLSWTAQTGRIRRLPPLRVGVSGQLFRSPSNRLLLRGFRPGDLVLATWEVDLRARELRPCPADDEICRVLAEPGVPDASALVLGPDGRPLSPPTLLSRWGLRQYRDGRWRMVALFERDHTAGAAVGLPSGEVLVLGGLREADSTAELCRLDPATRREPGPPRQPPRLASEDAGFVDGPLGLGWQLRCLLHLDANRLEAAEAACRRGLEVALQDSSRAVLYFQLSEVAERQGLSAEARRLVEMAIAADPSNPAFPARLRELPF